MRALVSALEERMEDSTSKGLAHAVTKAARDGVLQPGDRLPPIRDLARELVLSPTTVAAAWRVLTQAGTLRTAGRRGTVVADFQAHRSGRHAQVSDRRTLFETDLSTGTPDPHLLPFLGRAITGLSSAGTPASYLDEPVLPELADLLRASWPYPPPAVTVVDGAMDGLELTIRATLQFGDRVLVEDPTFPPLLDLLEAAGITVQGVALDAEGMIPQALQQALTTRPAAVFLQTRAHNPTGAALSPARLATLSRLLRDSDALIVEDDSAGAISDAPDLSFGSDLPHRTVHIRSYSKTHGPDLRLAAMSGPADVIGGIQRLRQLGQGWSSRLLQRILHHLLTDREAIAQVDAARAEYARRRGEFVTQLAGLGIETLTTDGLNVWVPVHDETSAVMRLAVSGVAVAPGRPFQLSSAADPHIRVTAGLIDGDVGALAELVAEAATTGEWSRTVR